MPDLFDTFNTFDADEDSWWQGGSMARIDELITHERRFRLCRDLLNKAGYPHATVRDFLKVRDRGYHEALLKADWLDSPHAFALVKAKLALEGLHE